MTDTPERALLRRMDEALSQGLWITDPDDVPDNRYEARWILTRAEEDVLDAVWAETRALLAQPAPEVTTPAHTSLSGANDPPTGVAVSESTLKDGSPVFVAYLTADEGIRAQGSTRTEALEGLDDLVRALWLSRRATKPACVWRSRPGSTEMARYPGCADDGSIIAYQEGPYCPFCGGRIVAAEGRDDPSRLSGIASSEPCSDGAIRCLRSFTENVGPCGS